MYLCFDYDLYYVVQQMFGYYVTTHTQAVQAGIIPDIFHSLQEVLA